jgi:hypothetical protein
MKSLETTSPEMALSTMLREHGDMIVDAKIDSDESGNPYILAKLKEPIDFFPDLMCGVRVVSWS